MIKRSTAWHVDAQCRSDSPDLYDVDRLPNGDETRAAVARVLCDGCPVLRQCAADALDPLAVGTLRAGVHLPATPSQAGRRKIRHRLAAIAAGSLDPAELGDIEREVIVAILHAATGDTHAELAAAVADLPRNTQARAKSRAAATRAATRDAIAALVAEHEAAAC